MAVYMIGYDLHRSESGAQDRLFSALEVIGTGYWDCLDSTWLVITDRTATEIRDELKRHLGDDDRLLVMRCGQGAAWLGFNDSCEAWLDENLGVPSDVADPYGQSYCGA